MKRLLRYLFGYGHLPRGPLPAMDQDEADKLLIRHPDILAVLDLENRLRDGSR
jgi:hypothetical protein